MPCDSAGGCKTSANNSVNVAACIPCAVIEKSNPANSNAGSSDTVGPVRPPLESVRLPALRIDERFIGLGDPLKERRGFAITGIDSRVIAARETPVRPLDIRGGRLCAET